MAAGFQVVADTSQSASLIFRLDDMLECSCRNECEREQPPQREVPHIAFDELDATGPLGIVLRLRACDLEHCGRQIDAHHLVSCVGERNENPTGARGELQDWPAEPLRTVKVEGNVAGDGSSIADEDIIAGYGQAASIVGVRIAH